MTNFFKLYKVPILLIILGIVSIIFVISSFNLYGKDYVTEIIQEFVQKEVKQIQEEYQNQIKLKDEQIQELTNKLSESEELYFALTKRVKNVESKIQTRKQPQTTIELRNRFIQLGYKPTN
ncbi:MAG: hypothetical protein WC188_04505 [Candidatus Caldatribacteriota bacterium]|nr:hypothetical protein [Patescibacteria group bacterium]